MDAICAICALQKQQDLCHHQPWNYITTLDFEVQSLQQERWAIYCCLPIALVWHTSIPMTNYPSHHEFLGFRGVVIPMKY